MPRKILVLIIEKISRPLDIFLLKICVINNKTPTNDRKYSNENIPKLEVIIKNQKEKPAVIASDLNRGDDVFILNWIYESHKSRLS